MKKCSVCKRELTHAFTLDKERVYKCRCGNWVDAQNHTQLVFEDAHSIKPTLRFLYD